MAFGALSSGISALNSFSKGMEVIGNNIANVNTVSFKSSRIKYSETFNQVLKQSAPSPSSGDRSNVQASQVGLGVQVEGIVGQFHQGGLSSTNQLTDLAISGEGFFLVQDPKNETSQFATRGGDFRIDDRGYLVTSGGMRVQGLTGGSIGFEVDIAENGNWTFVPNEDSQTGTLAPSTYGDIRLDYDKGNAKVVGPEHATAVESEGKLLRNAVMFTNPLLGYDAGENTTWGSLPGTPVAQQLDSDGKPVFDAATGWPMAETAPGSGVYAAQDPSTFTSFTPSDVVYGADAANPHRVGDFVYSVDANGDPTGITGVTGWHAFMEEAVSNLKTLRNVSTEGSLTGVVTDSEIEQAVSSDFFHRMFGSSMDLDARVQIDGNAVQRLLIGNGELNWDNTIDPQATVNAIMDTFPADFKEATTLISSVRAEKTPELSRFSIDDEGSIVYFLNNGDSFKRGQIQLIDFNDKTALIREGQNLYSSFGAAGVKEAQNGNPDGMQVAGTNGLGVIKQGALELSNVDLTGEFANMITTQRGFQAGSRIITVSDDILQEVVNLKR